MAVFFMCLNVAFAQATMETTAQASANMQIHTPSLAASCAACHGTFGNPVIHIADKQHQNMQLAGMNQDDFTKKLIAFKTGARASTVMHHHAKGLTEEEITALAIFFAAQKPKVIRPLQPQTLAQPHVPE